jgi:hypothetical protein
LSSEPSKDLNDEGAPWVDFTTAVVGTAPTRRFRHKRQNWS